MSSKSHPPEEVYVKEEPVWDEETSGDELRPQGPLSTEHVHVKEEVVEYLKEEWEDKAFYGVSESPALADLYAGHEVKDELVLGPEGLQPRDIVFTLYAAQALNTKEHTVLKDSVVRLERVDHVEALLRNKTDSNTYIETDKTYVCDICKKKFSLKTQLMEHVMVHIRQSSEREGSMHGDADNERSRQKYQRIRPKSNKIRLFGVDNLKNEEMDRAGEQKASVPYQDPDTHADVGEIHVVKHSKTANNTKKDTPYKCHLCSYSSAYKGNLLKHERRHTGEKPYKCTHCTYASVSKHTLLVHERIHTGEKPYKCIHCAYASVSKSHLVVHGRLHTGEKPYKCTHCSYASACKGPLVIHERKHSGEKAYKCSHCSYASFNKSNLMIHEKKHTAEKIYKCGLCSYASALKSNLLVHKRKHTGEKPFKCGQCSYAATRKTNLLTHEKQHTGEKPYTCSHCSYNTSNKNYLLVHERKHTGEKPYNCSHCTYASACKSQIRIHERQHTGEKPYKCTHCSYASTRKSNLLVHEKKHTVEKLFKCVHCSYATMRKSDLLVHEKRHTQSLSNMAPAVM